MTPGQDREPGPPPGHARAETYLRLRVEAELRRVQALPRPDLLEERGIPAPLRGPVRLMLPLAQRTVTAAAPLADAAGRAARPLAGSAERNLRPLAGSLLRAAAPLAGSAARSLQPRAGQVAGVVLPAAEQAAQRLHPLAWQAIGRLQSLQLSGAHQLRMWRWRACQAAAPLRRATGDEPGRAEPSAEDGLRRLAAVARALAWADTIDHATADAVVTGLETALVARSRIEPHRLWFRMRRGMRRPAARPPAGAYLAAPVGVLVTTPSGSGLGNIYLATMVIAPDRALLVMTGQLTGPDGQPLQQDPWPVFGGTSHPAATDDRGNSYELRHDGGWSNDKGEWGGTLSITPVPPAGIRWLDLTMSAGSGTVRVDLTAASGEAARGPAPAGSPAELLIDAAAMNLLAAGACAETGHLRWHDLSKVADIVEALDAVGALAPARDAVARLVTLAGRLGVDVPPVLAAAGPPRGLPAAWASVLENSRRHDGPRGVAAVAAVLPELDGTRFVLAGLRSDGAGAQLHVEAWGNHRLPGLFEHDGIACWTWSARDDRGRWHVLAEDSSRTSDQHAGIELDLKPPLHPEATSLEVTLAGRSGQVTATVPLDWRELR